MRVPLSWLKQFVEIDIPVELLAEKLTLAGLEVDSLEYIGVPQVRIEGVRQPKSDHLVWDRERILLGAIREVKPHPNADKLVLAMVDVGGEQPEQCVTGAPNLFQYREAGPLPAPLWTVYAGEGAEVWDGHSETPKRMILKEKALRGIPNKAMVCSEKELGMSGEHEGIILMHDAPGHRPGTPAQDVLGDVVLNIEFTPNLARALSIYGVAREIAAILGKPLRAPSYDVTQVGAPLEGEISVMIEDSSLTPRFTLMLLRSTKIQPSPEWMQRRLQAVGQRSINNIVDVTNYVMFEMGQPLHAFDLDKLKARVDGAAPALTTRLAHTGETLRTLDGSARPLYENDIIIADTLGVVSLSAVMGGADTEIDENTTNVLLEAANWHNISVRRTMQQHNLRTEAGTRFSRGVHPSQALLGVRRGIELMRQTGGGEVAAGVIDQYPRPPQTVVVDLPAREIERILGVAIPADEAVEMLKRAGFQVELRRATTSIAGMAKRLFGGHPDDVLIVTAPDDRLDIGEGVIGQADLIEEIGRMYGYDRVPNTQIADAMPPQHANPDLDFEEAARDALVALGLQENISYRLTSLEREMLLIPPGVKPTLRKGSYVEIANPIAADKRVMRHSVLVSLLENARANARHTDAQATFEIGAIYLKRDDQPLPDEPRVLAILMTGARAMMGWQDGVNPQAPPLDFYDLKGVIEAFLAELHITGATYTRAEHTSFHPGRSASLHIGKQAIGTFGELHPSVTAAFDLAGAPVLAADLDFDTLIAHAPESFPTRAVPTTPPVLQDIALIVDAETPAAKVEAAIRKAGGDLVKAVALFDVYTGDPIPTGKKNLAYRITYQTDDRTLTDKEVASVHARIVKACERDLGATLRG